MNKVPCRYCKRPVVFATDQNGKIQILDLRPPIFEVDGEGKNCLRVNGKNSPRVWTEELGDDVTYAVSHWSTCPKAAEVKREQKARSER